MAETPDIPAWIALFLGVYALSAAIGEFTQPGSWAKMMGSFVSNAGLRFLAGVTCIAIGAAVYLVSPWRPDDWLAIVITIMGGGMVAEGALFLAVGERFFTFWRGVLGQTSRGWAAFAGGLGIALIAVSLMRL